MYPLATDKPWPLDQWYIAGFAEEVGRTPIGRTLLGKRVVLFRDEAGVAHALSGICPHRMMPMEAGRLKGDTIVCAYHGLAFDTTGTCVGAPTAEEPPACALTPYPIRESGPLLWFWPGIPEHATETHLPDQEAAGLGAPGWRTDCVERFDLKARWAILIDNLFDLSHLGFVHESILGPISGLALVNPEIGERDGRLSVSRHILNIPVDPYHRMLHPDLGDRMSTALESDFIGVSLINTGGAVWNGPDTSSPNLGSMNYVHGVTPETETKTHYWTLLARNFRLNDDALSVTLATQNRAVVQQDLDALMMIEELLQGQTDLPSEVSMSSDRGAWRARMQIVRMVKAEGQEPAEVAA